MANLRSKIGKLLNSIESRLALYGQVASMLAGFGLPAWAAWATDLFSAYAPASWVAAGLVGLLIVSIARWLWVWAYRAKVRARFDERLMEREHIFNPLDMTFERRRIFLNDFVLPSNTEINGKTFIDCDIIGPANIYFHHSNIANPIRSPTVDAVWLHAEATYRNGFKFVNCIFRNCSFQRITMFASAENYDDWKNNQALNWISAPPSVEDIATRLRLIGVTPPLLPSAAEPKKIEDKRDGPDASTP